MKRKNSHCSIRVEKGDEIPITRAARSSTSLERIIKPLDSYEIKIVKSPASVHTVRPAELLSLSLSVRTANKSGSGSCVRLLRRLHLRRSTLLSFPTTGFPSRRALLRLGSATKLESKTYLHITGRITISAHVYIYIYSTGREEGRWYLERGTW